MSTPRTMNTVKTAAERAGERLYEQRKRHLDEAAKVAAEREGKPAEPAEDASGD